MALGLVAALVGRFAPAVRGEVRPGDREAALELDRRGRPCPSTWPSRAPTSPSSRASRTGCASGRSNDERPPRALRDERRRARLLPAEHAVASGPFVYSISDGGSSGACPDLRRPRRLSFGRAPRRRLGRLVSWKWPEGTTRDREAHVSARLGRGRPGIVSARTGELVATLDVPPDRHRRRDVVPVPRATAVPWWRWRGRAATRGSERADRPGERATARSKAGSTRVEGASSPSRARSPGRSRRKQCAWLLPPGAAD